MNSRAPSKLIAITGGSGAGKSWLVNQLRREFGNKAAYLSLDNFYRDLSHLTMSERETINFDDPSAIEWPRFEEALHALRRGAEAAVPAYDFVSHTRRNNAERCKPRAFILVDGLWPWWYAPLRPLFHLKVFLDCPESLRWQRRASRDVKERGRTPDSIWEQFYKFVVPMHDQYVEAQKPFADLVLQHPLNQPDIDGLVASIRALQIHPTQIALENLKPTITA